MAPGDLRELTGLPVRAARSRRSRGATVAPIRSRLGRIVRERDRLVHHPYDDFSATVLRLLRGGRRRIRRWWRSRSRCTAAGELAGRRTRCCARRRPGKEVAVFVELKASFDEARNIGWVRQLERAGAQVVYGLVGLKNHAKVALVVRREGGEIRRYVARRHRELQRGDRARLHRPGPALTADPAIARRPGRPVQPAHRQLARPGGRAAAACWWRRSTSCRACSSASRARRATPGPGGRAGSAPSSTDSTIPRSSARCTPPRRRASRSTSIVRGLCTLKPGVPGLSERIRVRGMVGRFLEHARIYHFANAGDGRVPHRLGRLALAQPSPAGRGGGARARPRRPPPARRHPGARAGRPVGLGARPDGSYRQARSLPVGDPATAQARAIVARPPPRRRRPYGPDDAPRHAAVCRGTRSSVWRGAGGQSPPPGADAGRHGRGHARCALRGRRLPQSVLRPALPRPLDHADPGRACSTSQRFAGGLRPTRAGGGKQTQSLRFDGRRRAPSTSSARSTRTRRRCCPSRFAARWRSASSRIRSARAIRRRRWW